MSKPQTEMEYNRRLGLIAARMLALIYYRSRAAQKPSRRSLLSVDLPGVAVSRLGMIMAATSLRIVVGSTSDEVSFDRFCLYQHWYYTSCLQAERSMPEISKKCRYSSRMAAE